MDNITTQEVEFQEERKGLGIFFFFNFSKGLFLGWGKEEVTSTLPRVIS